MKRCSYCLKMKPPEAFSKHGNQCKQCACEKTRAWLKANRERAKRTKAAYYQAHKLEWKIVSLRRKYGLTPEAVQRLWDEQQGRCAICGRLLGPGREMAIDHDHTTGRVRGILCPDCNLGLGCFRDSPEACARACLYLGFHRGDREEACAA